jgi:hypothetical protein
MDRDVPRRAPISLITAAHYVCAPDRSRLRLLVGPFTAADQAQEWIGPAQDYLLAQGELELAIEARVSRLVCRDAVARVGDLNAALGLSQLE